MNTLKIEEKLANKYHYQKLSDDLSKKYRNFFLENIPIFLDINGSDNPLYTITGSIICKKYDRIVIGNYGAFVEFSKEDTCDNFCIKEGQEYRIYDSKYSKNVKYVWYTINDGAHV